MRDAGGELAERGKFFSLHQAVLRGAEIVEGLRQLLGTDAQVVDQTGVLDGDHGLVGEILDELNLLAVKGSHLLAIDHDCAYKLVVLEHGYSKQGACPQDLDRGGSQCALLDATVLGLDIGDMDHLFGSDDPAERRGWLRDESTAGEQVPVGGWRSMEFCRLKADAIKHQQVAKRSLADIERVAEHGLEHRLEVAG